MKDNKIPIMDIFPAHRFGNLNQIIASKNMYLVSIVLTIAGSLSSWWCQGDFIHFCTPGVSINLSLYSLLTTPGQLLIVLIIAVIIGLVFRSLVSSQVRKIFGMSIAVLEVSYLIVAHLLIIEDNGGVFIILLSIVIAWLVVQAKVMRYLDRAMIVSGIMLVLASSYALIQAFVRQEVEKDHMGGFTVELGLPIILVGSLLILVTGVVRESKKLRL